MNMCVRLRHNLCAYGAAFALGVALLACTAPLRAATLVTQSLDSGWQFRLAPGDAHAKAHPQATHWLPATVPGVVQTDLMASRLAPDPYWRTNTKQMAWVGLSNWDYRTHFDVDAATLARRHVELVFDGIDTFADVYLNGHKLLAADNMFRRWRVPVKAWLHAGTNTLEVKLYSPIGRMLPWLRKQPYVLPGEFPPRFGNTPKSLMSETYVRKAAYQYGWDWGPRIITEGIWQDVKLESWNTLRLADFSIAQPSVTAAAARLQAQLDLDADGPQKVAVNIDWLAPDGSRHTLTRSESLVAGANHIAIPITIERPQRWWPAGYGKPDLYTFHVEVRHDGTSLADATRTTGLRSVELRRVKDQWGTSFEFVVNGVPIFAKGADFIPMDIFPTRVTPARIDQLLESARDANMNMLRVWGGGYYLPGAFYAEADRLGIMLWQEFMFGGAVPPAYDAAFRANVRAEAIQQVERLRDHPSIVLWCGNNELALGWHGFWDKFKTSIGAAQQDRIEAGIRTLFDGTLRDVVARYDPQVSYWPTSPGTGSALGPANVLTDGDYHYWDVWSGKAFPSSAYLGVTPRFMSEYGLQSMPVMSTIDSFTAPADRSLDSPVMRWHQKFDDGKGDTRLLQYITRQFGQPKDFAATVYLSQVMQAEGIQLAAEHLRASRPQAMGSLYWQLDDDWPGITWSSVDYYGRWKMLQWHAKRFYAPLLIAALRDHGTTHVTLVSDRTVPVAAQWRLRVMDFAGKVLATRTADVTLPLLSATHVGAFGDADLLHGANPRTTFAVFDLFVDGKRVSRNLVFFDAAKNLAMPVPTITTQLVPAADGYTLTLHSTSLAREVWVSFGDLDAKVSGNAFDILPGTSVTLTVQSHADLAALRKALTVQDLAAAMAAGSQ